MAKNVCLICGGGTNQYTAPEAKCVCKAPLTESQKEKLLRQEEAKHEMRLAESRYLIASGWRVHEHFEAAKNGFLWNPPHEKGPISQDIAVATQKEWDQKPEMKRVVFLSAAAMRLVTAIQVADPCASSTVKLKQDHQTVVEEIKETICQRAG